jgi:hypothetical protein
MSTGFPTTHRSFGLRFGERESAAEAERRRERSRSGTTVAEPQAEARRSFGIRNAARDERAFLRNGTGAVVRGFGRTAAGAVEQESALVRAIISGKISGNDKIFCVFDCQQICQQRSNKGVVPE